MRDFLCLCAATLRLQQLRVAYGCLGPGIRGRQGLVFLQRFLEVALRLQRPGVQEMALGRAEIGIQANEVIECRARRDRISLGELGAAQCRASGWDHARKDRQRLAILRDRFVMPTVTRELLRVALPAGDVAADAGFAFVTTKVRGRI